MCLCLAVIKYWMENESIWIVGEGHLQEQQMLKFPWDKAFHEREARRRLLLLRLMEWARVFWNHSGSFCLCLFVVFLVKCFNIYSLTVLHRKVMYSVSLIPPFPSFIPLFCDPPSYLGLPAWGVVSGNTGNLPVPTPLKKNGSLPSAATKAHSSSVKGGTLQALPDPCWDFDWLNLVLCK